MQMTLFMGKDFSELILLTLHCLCVPPALLFSPLFFSFPSGFKLKITMEVGKTSKLLKCFLSGI